MNRSKIAALLPRQYALLLCALFFLWPAVVNGGPFFFDDTTAYIRGVDAAAYRITGVPSDWTVQPDQSDTPAVAPNHATGAAPSSAAPRAPAIPTKPVLLGRSAYYGAILYLGIIFDSFWSVLLLQALVTAAVLLTLVRHFVDPANERRFAFATTGTFVLAAVTPLPFFVCLLMPDLFSGLAIVAAAIVLCGWKHERRLVRLGLAAVLTLAALVHSSSILLIAGMGVVFAMWTVVRTRIHPQQEACRSTVAVRILPAAILMSCALLGLGGEALFSVAITSMTGQPPIRPPFLTARFVDDGPGTQYLRAQCDHAPFLLCQYVERLPTPSDGFLWDKNPHTGVFMTLTPEKQRILASEQSRFVLASVQHAPVAAAKMLAHDFALQIGKTGLGEFNYTDAQRQTFNLKIPREPLSSVQRSLAYSRGVTTFPFEVLSLLLTVGSLGVFLWCWRQRSSAMPGFAYAAVGVLGVGINDLICGCLSTPHDRYQMRVIWVLPATALLILIAQRWRTTPQQVGAGATVGRASAPAASVGR